MVKVREFYFVGQTKVNNDLKQMEGYINFVVFRSSYDPVTLECNFLVLLSLLNCSVGKQASMVRTNRLLEVGQSTGSRPCTEAVLANCHCRMIPAHTVALALRVNPRDRGLRLNFKIHVQVQFQRIVARHHRFR